MPISTIFKTVFLFTTFISLAAAQGPQEGNQTQRDSKREVVRIKLPRAQANGAAPMVVVILPQSQQDDVAQVSSWIDNVEYANLDRSHEEELDDPEGTLANPWLPGDEHAFTEGSAMPQVLVFIAQGHLRIGNLELNLEQ